MGNPAISVLMGVCYVRKNAALLQRSVLSILEQDFCDFELLICDDGSNEEAKHILEEFAAKDKRIRLLRPGNVTQLAAKLNVCLRSAKGKYVARMDDDDFSHPNRFVKEVAVLEQNPQYAFVGSNVALIQNGLLIGRRVLPEHPAVEDFFWTQPFVHPALMFRKSALNVIGGYCEEAYCDHCEDYDLLLRLYAHGLRGMNIQEVLFDYTSPSIKGNRTMRHRWNEVMTRWKRYHELNVLPKALPYVLKPLVVGVLPDSLLLRAKQRYYRNTYN